MTVDLAALVLPAFDEITELPSEIEPWEQAYDFENDLQIEGINRPLRYSDAGVGVIPTGVGKVSAATTVTALLASDKLRVDDALIMSVGVAGGPPSLDIGSVVMAESVVDWDHKCRVDSEGEEDVPLAMNDYTGGVRFELNAERVDWAFDVSADVSLVSGTDRSENPRVVRGSNLCGDELWHGEQLAGQVEWLMKQHGVGPYLATEMEDAGTAFALDQFGYLDQYLSLRGISNYDRPLDDTPAKANLFSSAFEEGFEVGIENAVRVARKLIDTRIK